MVTSVNYQRMIELADQVFAAKSDPDQIQVDEEVVRKLTRLHRATMTEESGADGPVAWMLVIPTTRDLMERFLRKEIGERELLDETPVGGHYDAVYLCSALVLPEYRNRGRATRMLTEAVRSIQRDHPITQVFCWAFSPGGERLARRVARELGLPLHAREA